MRILFCVIPAGFGLGIFFGLFVSTAWAAGSSGDKHFFSVKSPVKSDACVSADNTSAYLVKVKPGKAYTREVFKPLDGVQCVEKLTGTPFYRVFPQPGRADHLSEILSRADWVSFFEKDISVKIPDERFNTGSTGWFAGQATIITPWQDIVEIKILQELSSGKGVTIAVIDSGIAVTLEALNASLYVNKDEIKGDQQDNDGNGFVDDVHGWNFGDNTGDINDELGHGTHVAWLLAHTAPAADLMVLKINPGGSSTFAASDLVQAVYYAADSGADVINLSLVLAMETEAVETAVRYALASGCLVVAAAGNNQSYAAFPAGMDEVVSVGATFEYEPSFNSPRDGGVDLVAPGELILTLDTDGSYTRVSGTSFSAPIVSGAAALIMGMNRYLKPDTVKSLMFNGLQDLGLPGKDDAFGWGMVNGSCLKKTVSPAIALPDRPFYAFSADREIKVNCCLPPTDTAADVYIAIFKDQKFWWLNCSGVWQNNDEAAILPVAEVFLEARGLEFSLFNDSDGVWADFSPAFLPSGLHQWGIALMKDNELLAPVSWPYMYLFH